MNNHTDSEEIKAQRIAELNDRCRSQVGVFRTERTGEGVIVFTRGIANLPSEVQAEICIQTRNFDEFTEANDPYGEHDFGSLEIKGAGTVFWKFDYYAPDRQHLSEDPADPEKTFRVLTIMLADEY